MAEEADTDKSVPPMRLLYGLICYLKHNLLRGRVGVQHKLQSTPGKKWTTVVIQKTQGLTWSYLANSKSCFIVHSSGKLFKFDDCLVKLLWWWHQKYDISKWWQSPAVPWLNGEQCNSLYHCPSLLENTNNCLNQQKQTGTTRGHNNGKAQAS